MGDEPVTKVGIVGLGAAGFSSSIPNISTRELMFEAAANAYEDAGIEDPRKEVGSFICCTEDLWEGWSIADEMVPDQLGGAGRPLCTVPADAITGLGNALMQLNSGIADVVVLEAHSRVSDVLSRELVEAMAQDPTIMRPLGMNNDTIAGLEMSAFFAGTSFELEDCDRVIAHSREQATKNPRASCIRGGRRSTHPAVTAPRGTKNHRGNVRSRGVRGTVLSSPLRDIDRAGPADACIVLVVATEAWVENRRARRETAIAVEGIAWNSSLPWFEGGDPVVAEYARSSFSRAVKMMGRDGAGTLEQVDILELDDIYSYKLIQHLLSITGSESEARLVLEGSGPALNPSSGSLGVGDLIEAKASHRLLEVALQLRGDAGKLQVRNARRALVQSWRGIPTASGGVAVLSRWEGP